MLINIYESELEALRAELKEKDKIIANLKKDKKANKVYLTIIEWIEKNT